MEEDLLLLRLNNLRWISERLEDIAKADNPTKLIHQLDAEVYLMLKEAEEAYAEF